MEILNFIREFLIEYFLMILVLTYPKLEADLLQEYHRDILYELLMVLFYLTLQLYITLYNFQLYQFIIQALF